MSTRHDHEYKPVSMAEEGSINNELPHQTQMNENTEHKEKRSIYNPEVRRQVAVYWIVIILIAILVSGHFRFDNDVDNKPMGKEDRDMLLLHEKCFRDVPFDGFSMEFKDCWESQVFSGTKLLLPRRATDVLHDKWFHFTGTVPSQSFSITEAFHTLMGGDPDAFPENTSENTKVDISIKKTKIRITWSQENDIQIVLKQKEVPDSIFVYIKHSTDKVDFPTDVAAINSFVAMELSATSAKHSVVAKLSALHPMVMLVNQDTITAPAESASRFAWLQLWKAYGELHDGENPLKVTSILNAMNFNVGQRSFVLLVAFLFILWQPYALSHVFGIDAVPEFYTKIGIQEELLRQCFGFVLAVVVAMFADLQNVFPSTEKLYSRAAYYLIMIAVIGLAWTTRVKAPPTSDQWKLVLNREQTEEWKGWLQIAFILYHYMGAHEGLVYFPVRVYVACYVWLTGFGNFSFFVIKKDFSLRRVVKMMIRINLLIMVVLIAMPEVEYMRYYICPMHSIYFLFVWLTMRVQQEYNTDTKFMVTKLAVALGILVFSHEIISKSMFEAAWSPLRPLLQSKGELREWRFRFALDGYATWYGMVCAFVVSKLKSHEIGKSLDELCDRKVIGFACAGLILWCSLSFPYEKHTFVRIHRYTSLIPITAYLVLRNSTQALREWYLPSLAWVGRHSLEIYILQCQLFMNHNGEAHLSWSPKYPILSLVINAMIVMFFAGLANEGTLAINNFLIPSKETYGWILQYRIIPISTLFGLILVIASL